jgi:hypothetical protein
MLREIWRSIYDLNILFIDRQLYFFHFYVKRLVNLWLAGMIRESFRRFLLLALKLSILMSDLLLNFRFFNLWVFLDGISMIDNIIRLNLNTRRFHSALAFVSRFIAIDFPTWLDRWCNRRLHLYLIIDRWCLLWSLHLVTLNIIRLAWCRWGHVSSNAFLRLDTWLCTCLLSALLRLPLLATTFHFSLLISLASLQLLLLFDRVLIYIVVVTALMGRRFALTLFALFARGMRAGEDWRFYDFGSKVLGGRTSFH